MGSGHGGIVVAVYEASMSIDEWRVTRHEFQVRRSSIGYLGEKGFISVLAVAINIGFFLIVATGLQAHDVLQRLRFSPTAPSIEVILLGPPGREVTQKANAGGPAITRSQPPSELPSSRVAKSPKPNVMTRDKDPVEAGEETRGPAQSELDRLRGIYRTQIAARIERALEGARFVPLPCSVRLAQSPNGNIRQVTLGTCLADRASQHRVLEAIRETTPLPAPPRPDIFGETLIIQLGRNVTVQVAGPGP